MEVINIADFRLPIANLSALNEIGYWQLAIGNVLESA